MIAPENRPGRSPAREVTRGIITEQVFGLPGIGNVAFDAMLVADIPFIMGYNMFLALLSVIGVLLADLMYAVVDPRVKLG